MLSSFIRRSPGGNQLEKPGLIALLTLSLAASLAAQGGPGRPPAPSRAEVAAKADAVERGRTLFKQNCVACHGDDATGGRGPDLIRSSVVRHDKNGDQIGPLVTSGRPEKGMPPFPFSQAQIADLVVFLDAQLDLFDLHTRFGPYPNDIPAERLATGSVEAGKAYFNGPGKCNTCHSPTGDLAGIAKKYNPPDLEVRFLYPSGTPTTAVVTDRSGKTFEGTVLLHDDFNIAIMGKDGWYHSWPQRDVKVELHDPIAVHAELLEKYTDADMHNLFTYLETLQ
jgi:cytochrome c oxidase cbb3-type subunit 3